VPESKTGDIIRRFEQEIGAFEPRARAVDVGTVIEVGDGVASVAGLSNVMYNEMLKFSSGVRGIALSLEHDAVKAVILGDYTRIAEGDAVFGTGFVASAPVGEGLLGRVVDALGRPLDGKGPVRRRGYSYVERPAPAITARDAVRTPLHTGILAIDAMVPVGRGQRELIIGDRQTGKTALAVDTILSQREAAVVCVYVAIGQKLSSVAQVVHTLEQHGAMDYTIVVVAAASDPAALQYIAPYAGCAMAEFFMEKGQDSLVIYDDLTKHAWAYRQLSLLLRRPPGREAYPGDIFYLHSRLLERAGQLGAELGGGSLTALPIVETQLGDISAYVPTNIISITDGQVYLEADLFHSGIRPALNVGLSVSRVGGAAQTKAMRQVAGRMRLDLAQYRELAAFAQFGSDLDVSTRAMLDRGRRTTEILKQPPYAPRPLEQQVMSIYLVTRGYLDNVPLERIKECETAFHRYVAHVHAQVGQSIASEEQLSPDTEVRLKAAIEEFKEKVWPALGSSEGISGA
jgi:F-type H+-transporting ATPase subunit alpha